MKQIKRVSELERAYINEVLDGGFQSAHNYEMVTRLEKAFAEKFQCKYAVAMTNGTATLHAALEVAGVGEGDEVIVPALTMSSTNICVLQANAIPVFADVDPQTFTLSVESVKEKITERTKAVIPVSLYGLSADIDPIMTLAEKPAQVLRTGLRQYRNRQGQDFQGGHPKPVLRKTYGAGLELPAVGSVRRCCAGPAGAG